jgi:hypothetical protein
MESKGSGAMDSPLLVDDHSHGRESKSPSRRGRNLNNDDTHAVGGTGSPRSGSGATYSRQWLPAVAVPVKTPYCLACSTLIFFCVAFITSALLYREHHTDHCAVELPAIHPHVTPHLLYVLGGQIISDGPINTGGLGAIIPALHTLSRTQAAAMVMNRLGVTHTIISGIILRFHHVGHI